ncbi:hypothetical protein HF325_004821 [Metschnikowia pulcherrima]|uniref:DNA topoisomerase (ATP-hydrolyzing) n=1 Tax=Metschnikowia pulcherrima TaxID=27326 RepID=A0A8H7LDH1_9ASCO|nr:hypothetical protein HF325_004821 [Metschnikowia pulcherrima]
MFKIKLKALVHHGEYTKCTASEEGYGQHQRIVSLVDANSGHLPISVLEQIWTSIASSDDTELVLKVKKGCKNSRTVPQMFGFIREFAETEAQAHRFTAVLTTLRLVTQNLRRQSITTLRDIYYKDVSAYHGSQRRLNDSLKLISASLGYNTELELNVNPSPKGLLFGGPRIHLAVNHATDIELGFDKECALIPAGIIEESYLTGDTVDVVVVIEKEAVFKSFSGYLLAAKNTPKILVLTGKGNPDKASTRFLQVLRKSFFDVPVVIFVDSDVYGLRILWTYMLAAGGAAANVMFAGTFLLEHERGYLTIARIEWKLMMNFLAEIMALQSQQDENDGLIYKLMRRELTRGMLLGKKAELNVMCDSSPDDDLNTYMWKKIAQDSVTKRDPAVCTPNK